MKLLAFIILAASLIGCGSKEAIYDELSAADQAAIASRAYDECKTNMSTRFNNFKDGSEGVYSSDSWQRNDAWKHEFKASGSSTAEVVNNIRVWKNSGTEIYFLITREKGSETKVFFLRIPSTVNDSLIDNLKEQVCRQQVDLTGSSSPLSVVYEYTQNVGTGTEEYTETYKFYFDKLAYTGSAWNFTRKLIKKDSNGTTTSTTTLNSTLSVVTGQADLSTDYTTYSGATFCDIAEPTADSNGITYKLPYQIPEPASCATSLPGTWSITP